MVNLICFPHYTCGGLLTDILNDTFSLVENGGIRSDAHSTGKIGDNDSVFVDYNAETLYASVADQPDGIWVGTHCWPGNLDASKFDKIINVTTETWPSQLYRWARIYHHYYQKQWPKLEGIDLIDKLRETAKNYVVPFKAVIADNIENLEFSDIVNQTNEFLSLLEVYDYYSRPGHELTTHIIRWRQLNEFLYNSELWTGMLGKALYEAEVEIKFQRYYRYN